MFYSAEDSLSQLSSSPMNIVTPTACDTMTTTAIGSYMGLIFELHANLFFGGEIEIIAEIGHIG